MEGNRAPFEQLRERETTILKRLAAGLSDQQIADDLVLSLHTVKWYNRQIYSKLGVTSRTQAIVAAKGLGVLPDAVLFLPPTPPTPPTPPRVQLPAQSTSFIGRERELADVTRLLSRSRLLTLTGPGGAGKTRLAIEAAHVVADDYADGVCFVDLAPLADHSLVAAAIARTLGMVEASTEALLDALTRVLAQRDLLLLIDNFEHVIQAAPLISALLAVAPRLKILVTSRESLHLAWEQEYSVPPLSLPVADAGSARDLAASEAGTLFLQRARMALPHFAVNDANAPAIAAICIRLDGLPLAIELAAARCKLLTPQALVERLAGSSDGAPFQALAGGARDAPRRHRTLRDTLAWSYSLLSQAEQTVFARLAVFRGGRSLEAIAVVCGPELGIDVHDVLASLVDKSLVRQQEGAGGEPRFVLLELIQAYAHERLKASGEAETVRRRHAEYFVALAESAESDLRRSRYDAWCRVFEHELENIRAALEWTLASGDATLGVRLAGAIGLFWYGKGHHVEGLRWTRELLARLDEAPACYHPKFLMSAVHMALFDDLAMSQRLLKQALDRSHELGDQLQAAWALAFLSYTMMHEPQAAMPIAEEALATFRALQHQPGIAQALHNIGEIARLSGDDERARHAYEECLSVCQETGETRRICYLYTNLAFLAQHAGDYARAMRLAREGLQLARDRQDKHDMAEALITVAGSMDDGSARDGTGLHRSARLLGAAEATFERIGAFQQPSNRPEYDRIVSDVRSSLGDAAFQVARAEGRGMTLEQAITYVLEDDSTLD